MFSSVEPTKTLDVYNCTIDKISPVTIGELSEYGKLEILKNPYEKTLWLPDGAYHTCPFMITIRVRKISLVEY